MSVKDEWTSSRLEDKIFNNLLDNGLDITKGNKYINQIVDKFRFFRIKSHNVYFEIHKQDLDTKTIQLIETYIQDCKTPNEIYLKLNGILTEVIARIVKQAEP